MNMSAYNISTKYEKNTCLHRAFRLPAQSFTQPGQRQGNLLSTKKRINYYKFAFRTFAKNSFFVGILLVAFTSCKKEKEKIYEYVYEVKDVNVNQAGVNKPNVKSTVEFISIAYSDLFGTTIDQVNLTNLSLAYIAFGDKKFIEDMIIRNFLNKSGVVIPTKAEMTADVSAFVKATYRKFYNREPNEFEKWQLVNYINSDSNVTPELVYYSFMTSDEYRYY